MSGRLPDFRNIFTTGNIISVVGGAFIAGTAWMTVQNTLSAHGTRIEKLEKKEEASIITGAAVHIDIAVIKKSQENTEKDIESIKKWLEKISERQK